MQDVNLTPLNENSRGADLWSILRWFLFIVSLLFFLVMHISLVYLPIRARAVPVETTVAYNYIQKAEQINSSCFFQDCPALDDLRTQLTEQTADLKTQSIRARIFHRTFVIYHPLHSLALATLERAGFSYEKAYDIVAISGIIIICAGIVSWLFVIYGRDATTISLFFLAPLTFLGHGLNSVVPNNLALGFGLMLWALAIDRKRSLFWLIIPLVLASLLAHEMGKIYAAIGLTIYYFNLERPIPRRQSMVLWLGLLLLAVSFIAPSYIQRPVLSYDVSSWYPTEIDYIAYLSEAFAELGEHVSYWIRNLGTLSTLGLLVAFGVVRMTGSRKRIWLLVAGLLALLLLASVVYIDPWYGPVALERTWVPIVFFLSGALGYSVWVLLRYVLVFGKRHLRSKIAKSSTSGTKNSLLHSFIALVVLCMIFVQAFTVYMPENMRLYRLTLNHQITYLNYRFDESQPGLLVKTGKSKTSRVIYLNEDSLYYYLVYGGMSYGALYYPAVEPNTSSGTWEQNMFDNASFLVGENPVYQVQKNPNMEIALDDNAQLTIRGIAKLSLESVKVFIIHNGRPVDLEIEWRNGNEVFTTYRTIQDNTEDWIDFSQQEFPAEEIAIRLVGFQSLVIRGISFENQPVTNWPWDPGITLTLVPVAGDPIAVEISESSLAGTFPLDIEVIDDDGITVLAKVSH